jgi:phosphate uptake regulator
MGRRRLRDDVEKAIKDRDKLLEQVKESVEKVDRAQNELIREYEEANGVLSERRSK